MSLFDPHRYKMHLARAYQSDEDHRFLYNDIAAELIDRLQDIKRNFANVLDLSPFPLRFTTQNAEITHLPPPYTPIMGLKRHCYDLVFSHLALHWIEDIVGFLIQARQALQPDGLFLCTFYGGDTLHELRTSLMEAEIELSGGASMRTAPMTRLQDAPSLLSRAGFALPVVDTETYTITYSCLRSLIMDLRGMAETLKIPNHSIPQRQLFKRTEEIYRENYNTDEDKLPVTVEVLTLTGWAPCPA